MKMVKMRRVYNPETHFGRDEMARPRGARRMKLLTRIRVLIVFPLLASGILLADSVDDYVKREMEAKHIPGMAVVVLKDGKVIKQKAYGVSNIELNVPATLRNVYPVASITKLFTVTAVFLLVQEGKIRLDQEIIQLLPGLPNSWKNVTILNCLSHTSGIPDYPGIYDSRSPPADAGRGPEDGVNPCDGVSYGRQIGL
jgi:CubicO group peptidase (beta-lactamase class C family)